MLRFNSIVMGVIALVLVGLSFIFVVYGGLDKFKEPIQIVVPTSVSGLLCIKLVSNLTSDASSRQLKYWVQENGRSEMDEDLLRSHRKKQFFRAANAASPLVTLPDDAWFPIMTENDSKNGVSYSLYWLGTKEGWMKFSEQNGDKPLCLPS